jgi:tRNA(fMet)-specific endonuclease VapC
MLDTSIASDLIRNPSGRAAGRARALDFAVCVSIIVAAELRYGCARRGSPQLTRRVEAFLSEVPALSLDGPADGDYGRIRTALEAAGCPIGPNDLFIAAHAVAVGATLVTANVKEFQRVPGLIVENWLE